MTCVDFRRECVHLHRRKWPIRSIEINRPADSREGNRQIFSRSDYFHFILCFKSGKFDICNLHTLKIWKFFSFNFLSVSFQTFFLKLYKKCLFRIFRITSAARWRRFGWSLTFGMPRDSTWFQGSFFHHFASFKSRTLVKIHAWLKSIGVWKGRLWCSV